MIIFFTGVGLKGNSQLSISSDPGVSSYVHELTFKRHTAEQETHYTGYISQTVLYLVMQTY